MRANALMHDVLRPPGGPSVTDQQRQEVEWDQLFGAVGTRPWAFEQVLRSRHKGHTHRSALGKFRSCSNSRADIARKPNPRAAGPSPAFLLTLLRHRQLSAGCSDHTIYAFGCRVRLASPPLQQRGRCWAPLSELQQPSLGTCRHL